MRVLARKVMRLAPVLLIVSFLSFLLLNLLPGDPTIAILGPSATTENRLRLRHQLHLDQSFFVRFWHWLGHSATGHLGQSYVNGQPVLEAIRQRLPVTLELLILSQVVALLISVPLGVLAARKPNGWLDRVSTSSAFAFLALPNFILGVVLVYLFAVKFKLFPATGYTPLTQDPVQNLRSMVLPTVTLAVAELCVYLRLLRTDMIATLQEDFITMAKAKGLPESRVLLRHALRPSTFSLVTVAGLNFGRLIGGTLVVELIFALPGVGFMTVQAIYQRDYLVVQGVVLLIATAYVLVNFLVDLVYVA